MAAAISTVCNIHKFKKVPSFCLNHSLLVFCCPWCLKKEQTQREDVGVKELCNIITAGTAAHYLDSSMPITPNAHKTTTQEDKAEPPDRRTQHIIDIITDGSAAHETEMTMPLTQNAPQTTSKEDKAEPPDRRAQRTIDMIAAGSVAHDTETTTTAITQDIPLATSHEDKDKPPVRTEQTIIPADYLERTTQTTQHASNTTAQYTKANNTAEQPVRKEQKNKRAELVERVETQIEKAKDAREACQKLLGKLKKYPDVPEMEMGKLQKYLQTRSDLEQMHIYLMTQFTIFLNDVDQTENAYMADSKMGLTYKCNSKKGCKTCNLFVKKNQTAVIDNTAGKTFVILKDTLQYNCNSDNAVYAINCNKCRVVLFVGQAELLRERIGFHRHYKTFVTDHAHFESKQDRDPNKNRYRYMRVRVICHNVFDKTVRTEIARRMIEEMDLIHNGLCKKAPSRKTFLKRLREVNQQSRALTETYGELFNDDILQLLKKLELSEEGVIEDPLEKLDPFPAFRGRIKELDDIQLNSVSQIVSVRLKSLPSTRRQPKNLPSVVDDVDVPIEAERSNTAAIAKPDIQSDRDYCETGPTAIGSFLTTVVESIVDRRTKDMRQCIAGLESEVKELTTHLKRSTLTTREQETHGTQTSNADVIYDWKNEADDAVGCDQNDDPAVHTDATPSDADIQPSP